MNFSDLLREAIDSAEADLSPEAKEQIASQVQDFLQAWVAIHEPAADPEDLGDPQRALVLQMLEELGDRIPIPIVS